ncbi:phosphatase PAP2 family protein [Asanoa sp. NPDC049573]|uniref:phosphatase PAP2 family protein n=1 Tax=Asanoa sp. NPDC049573 TaxID=3155396 RepID=UPI003444A651
MNYRTFEAINGLAGRVDGVDDPVEFVAVWLIFGVFAVAAGLCLHALLRRRFRPVAEVCAALALAFLVGLAVGGLGLEQRPFQAHPVHQLIAHAPGTSLPSDHATAAFAVALAVTVFLHRRWGLALLVAAVLIGLARIWVGVHYPADILASLVIAALAVGVVVLSRRLPAVAERH